MGEVRNGAAEEDWHRDLKPGKAAMLEGGDHVALAKVGTMQLCGAPSCHVA